MRRHGLIGRRMAALRALPRLALPAVLALLVLAGCATGPEPVAPGAPAGRPGKPATGKIEQRGVPILPPAGSGRGGYYKDDGPGENPPPNLEQLPDAEVRNDPLLPRSNRPYTALGRSYVPISGDQPFSQRGLATWYGKKFHGQRTSSGETYDMYKMTAAHPTLPIPSYARLTDIVTGKKVIVRINDRGPFHSSRIVDVSYAAALKLGMLSSGSHELLLERILPDEVERMRANKSVPLLPPAPLVGAAMEPPSYAAPHELHTVPEANSAGWAEPLADPLAATPPERSAMVVTAGDSGAAIGGMDSGIDPAVVGSKIDSGAETAPAGLTAGFYLQLGAYTRAENAEAAKGQLVPFAGRLANLLVVQAGVLHRVYSGPYASRDDASQAARALPDALGIKPMVVQR